MHPFLLLALIALTASEGDVVEGEPVEKCNIVGGKDTDISEVPHMVSVLFNGNLICGGSIVNEYTILTAAHCLRRLHPVDKLSVRCGSSFHNAGGRIYFAESVTIHEKFNSTIFPDYDVGLIRVNGPIEYGKNVRPIPLPRKAPETGETVRISGWGNTEVFPRTSEHLQSTEVDIVDWQECQNMYKLLTPRMICASRAGKDSCYGDSGGGMDYEGTVVGIVSFGMQCADPDYPGVYTNVANPEILQFIRQHLN